MSYSYNKKKLNFFNVRIFLKYFIIIFFFFCLLFFIYNELKNKESTRYLIQVFSDKFDYNYKDYKINILKRTDLVKVSEIMKRYLDQSIFLIPLDVISEDLHHMNWVKSVDLTTNLKNQLSIEIIEHKPIGLYLFNKQLFYFSKEGKIIDQFNKKINDIFIVFHGNKSLKKADNFLNIKQNNKQIDLLKIKEAYYINGRRWNVKLDNDLILFLSEKNIENSFLNYIKLLNKLKKSEIISIKSIDLRNDNKAIVSLKIDD